MKKILYGMMAATMIFATSCENELELGAAGEESMVSFTIATPDMGSRAYSDGTTATVLQYAVYDAEGNELEDLTVTNGEIHGSTTVNLKLTTGNTYSVIFWAAAPGAPYTVDFGAKTMTVNYTNAVSNDESRDAFYKYHTFTVSGAQTEAIELKRPFAQLNIGTSDYDDSEKAGYIPTQSAVTVKNVYNTLDLKEGKVSGEVVANFGLADIKKDETFPVANCEYIAMNYLLVGADKETVDVEFTYTNGSNAKTRTVGSVPVQRNYRTNIYGQLLTSDVNVNVEIKPGFDGVTEEITNIVNNINELQAALDAATTGTTTIYLGKDIEGDVIDFQKADRNIVIEGGNNKYNGTIKIHTGSNYNNGTIKIQNVAFETSKASLNFIMPNDFGVENGVTRRYSQNVTVEKCTFTATGAAENTAVGVQAKSCKNLQIIECTATGMHSLVQAQSCGEDVIVKDCTINGKNGVAFKQVKNAVVENTTITAAAYGIRFDGNTDNYGITAKNINVTAVQPFIVRKMTGANNTIALEGDNTLTVSTSRADTSKPYQIIITNGSDDEAYVEPTGTYTLTGADDYLVYPRDVFVSSWDEFAAALAANKATIILSSDITYDANYQLQKAVTIDLNGKAMTLPMINIHSTSTVKNGTINGKVYARKNSEIVFDKVTFSGEVADNLSTEGHLAIQGGCKSLYAKDCLFSPTSVSGSQTKPLSFEGGSTIMKFEGCEFKSSPYKKQVYFNSLSAAGSLDFTNCNFNNKTPNIMFAATCPLTNLTMSGTTKLSSVTLETNRAKDAVTAEDLAYLRESLIANNSMSSVRLFYAGGSSEYIR